MNIKAISEIMLILLSTLLLTGFNAPVSASDTNLTGEIEIGALLSMTGDLSTFGENHKAAAELAVEEVNAFSQASGMSWVMNLVVKDTMTKPDIALEKTESLAARGIDLIIGPLSSAEVRAIKSYCDANKILAISQSSTAPDLAIADDYIFRFCATDKLGQGPAIARIMYDDGKRYVIPVTRNDAWGVGLEGAAKLKFEGLGGTFLPGILYDPDAIEFSTEAADLATKVSDAIATYGADEVAVLHISFEEVTAFMTACLAYAELDDVKWYGSDGTCTSGAMVDDPSVRDFALSVEYPCTLFDPTHSDKWEKVRQNGLAVLGREPDLYAYVVYDIVWVYALSLLEVDAYDSEAVKAVLPTVTRNYFGASGWIVLNVFGDRESGDYDMWQIVEIDGYYDWEVVGRYLLATDSVVWSPLVPPPVYVFEPVYHGKFSYVVTESNSTVSDYHFDPSEGPIIMFNVTGLEGATGFCRVAIPKQLLWVEDGDWIVLVDGDPVDATVFKEDDYYTHLHFTYSHSTKTVQVVGTHTIPLSPVARFSYSPESPRVGETVTFNASASNDPDGTVVSYAWDFGDGTYGSGMIVEHAYATAGTYNVALTVIDNDGLADTTAVVIPVSAPPMLSIKLSGEHDYLFMENVKIRLAALVKRADTMEPVSDANVTIDIYDPDRVLWVSDMMVEMVASTGIYEWESEGTIRQLRLGRGVYLVHVQASCQGGPSASDILEFHIDPPAGGTNQTLYHIAFTAVALVGLAGLILKRRKIVNRLRKLNRCN